MLFYFDFIDWVIIFFNGLFDVLLVVILELYYVVFYG